MGISDGLLQQIPVQVGVGGAAPGGLGPVPSSCVLLL